MLKSARILIGYTRFPEWDRNSGALREFEIARLLMAAGHRVTFLGERLADEKYRKSLEELGVVCVQDDDGGLSASVSEFRRRVGVFDVAVLSHDWVFRKYEPLIRDSSPGCTCVFDTVDLQFVRVQREVELGLRPAEDAERLRRLEWRAIESADEIWVVTDDERQRLASMGVMRAARVQVVPNIHRPVDTRRPGSERSGVVFIGGYKHRPNVDAVDYFMKEIEPLLRERLPQVRIRVVGSHPPLEFERYSRSDGSVEIVGFVQDHRETLSSAKVGIAPLRYGAGMKGKIGEYLACGLPCVTTSIGAEGMGLRDDIEAIIEDDPLKFAEAIVRLHDDPELWERMSAAGTAYIERQYGAEVISGILCDAISSAMLKSRPGTMLRSRRWLTRRLRAGRNWYRSHRWW